MPLCRMVLGSLASSDSASSGGVGAGGGGGVAVDTRDPLDPLDLPKSQVKRLLKKELGSVALLSSYS